MDIRDMVISAADQIMKDNRINELIRQYGVKEQIDYDEIPRDELISELRKLHKIIKKSTDIVVMPPDSSKTGNYFKLNESVNYRTSPYRVQQFESLFEIVPKELIKDRATMRRCVEAIGLYVLTALLEKDFMVSGDKIESVKKLQEDMIDIARYEYAWFIESTSRGIKKHIRENGSPKTLKHLKDIDDYRDGWGVVLGLDMTALDNIEDEISVSKGDKKDGGDVDEDEDCGELGAQAG